MPPASGWCHHSGKPGKLSLSQAQGRTQAAMDPGNLWGQAPGHWYDLRFPQPRGGAGRRPVTHCTRSPTQHPAPLLRTAASASSVHSFVHLSIRSLLPPSFTWPLRRQDSGAQAAVAGTAMSGSRARQAPRAVDWETEPGEGGESAPRDARARQEPEAAGLGPGRPQGAVQTLPDPYRTFWSWDGPLELLCLAHGRLTLLSWPGAWGAGEALGSISGCGRSPSVSQPCQTDQPPGSAGSPLGAPPHAGPPLWHPGR